MPERHCFVISPIGERGSLDRRRADGILNEIIKPALEPKGYLVERADHDKSPGIVTESFISRIFDSELVVADLTGLNPNVMYELAVRHASGRPVIQMLEEGHELPFDVRSQNTLYFTCDLAGRAEAIRNVQMAEEAVNRASDLGNPIKRTAELRGLLASGKGQDSVIARAIVEIQSELSRLRLAVQSGREVQDVTSTRTDENQWEFFAQEALRALTVPPFSADTMVLHFIASHHSVAESELIRELTKNTDPVHLAREEGDHRMAIQRLIDRRLVERTSDGKLVLHATIAAAGYKPPKDTYSAL